MFTFTISLKQASISLKLMAFQLQKKYHVETGMTATLNLLRYMIKSLYWNETLHEMVLYFFNTRSVIAAGGGG